MNLEEIIERLKEYGEMLETPGFFIILANKLAKSYHEYFTEEKIQELFNSTFFLEASRLPLEKFDPNERKYLIYPEKIKIELNDASFEVNLQNQVEKLNISGCSINDHMQELPQVLSLLRNLNIKIEEAAWNEELFNINLTSLIYQYAFLNLKENVKTTIDSVQAGMFKNAYYNIIELKLLKYFPNIQFSAENVKLHA